MKKIVTKKKNNFFKKIFIKICRILGYEIIDQNNFTIPTLNKNAFDNISIAGKKSISIPLGEIKINRKVNSLNIYFRSCSKVKLWKQNKERVFEASKDEYSLRSLNSLIISIKFLKLSLNLKYRRSNIFAEFDIESFYRMVLFIKQPFKNRLFKRRADI